MAVLVSEPIMIIQDILNCRKLLLELNVVAIAFSLGDISS